MKQRPMTNSRERTARQRIDVNIFRLFSVAIFVSYLAGCASTGLPTVKERIAVGAGEKAIVLVRVQCKIENQQPYEVFSYSLMEDNISFGLGSFKTGGEPERLALLRFLSPESRKNGWAYFVLPHGIHYLAVYPPRRTDVFTYERCIRNAPRWRIEIPQDVRLVYAGTLHFTGESDWLLLGGRILRSIRIDAMSVTNDEELARKLLMEELPGFGEAQTFLLSLQQGPIILRSPLPLPTK
jgi:hypothetical protein